jgi:hypothetical protein
MEKVVPFFKSFMTIFYFNTFELRKVIFGLVNAWKNLNIIWIRLKFEIESNFATPPGSVAEVPHLGDPCSHVLRCSVARQWPGSAAHTPRPPDPPSLHAPPGPPSLPLTAWRHSPLDPQAFALLCPPCKRAPPSRPPFFSLSLAALSSPDEALHAPYTSPRCLMSESITGSRQSTLSTRRRGPHVAEPLQSTSGAAFTLTSTALVPFSCLTSKLTPASSPPAGRRWAPLPRLRHCLGRNAAPSSTSSVPDPPWWAASASFLSGDLPSLSSYSCCRPRDMGAAGEPWPPVPPCRLWPRWPRHALAAWHGPVGPLLRGHGPRQQAAALNQVQPWAESRPDTIHPISRFLISFTFPEIRLNF